jgi:hypothetical protein
MWKLKVPDTKLPFIQIQITQQLTVAQRDNHEFLQSETW